MDPFTISVLIIFGPLCTEPVLQQKGSEMVSVMLFSLPLLKLFYRLDLDWRKCMDRKRRRVSEMI